VAARQSRTNPWPADKVERWPIAKLIPHPRNARTHSEEQVSQIAASIREWGWTNPILVTEKGSIIAGHGRVLGARKLGLADVPVMVARGWSKVQIQAYALADNKLALNAGYRDELDLGVTKANAQVAGFLFNSAQERQRDGANLLAQDAGQMERGADYAGTRRP
jgi:ParB-like chromosome segregation protein Spo0J